MAIFKPAKKKGWEKIRETQDITLMVGGVRSKHKEVRLALEQDRLADAFDFSLKATLSLQEVQRHFKETKLGKYGYDLRALIEQIEKEDKFLWNSVFHIVGLRTNKETKDLFC